MGSGAGLPSGLVTTDAPPQPTANAASATTAAEITSRATNPVNTSEATLLKLGRYERSLLVRERDNDALP